MNRFIFVVLFFLSIVFSHICFSNQDAIPQSIKMDLSKVFTASDVKSIEITIEKAGKEGLPVKYLMPRLSEAALKKVKYEQLSKVLNKKTGYMRTASNLIWRQIKEGRKASELNEDINLLAELIERNLLEEQWQFIASRADKQAPVENIIERTRLLVILYENGYSSNASEELTSALFETDVNTASKITDLLVRYPSSKAKEIVIRSLGDKKNISSIKKELQAGQRSETVKEVIEERRKER